MRLGPPGPVFRRLLAPAALLLLAASAGHAGVFTHTSQADFSTGTYAGWGSSVASTGGGAVALGLSGAEVMGWSTGPLVGAGANLPAARNSPEMSVWNGRLYVAGGHDGTSAQSTVYSAPLNADGTVGAWTTEANSLPAVREGHAMSVWNGRLYVTGGEGPPGGARSTVYSAPLNADASVGAWTTETNSLPAARTSHAMSVWNGRLYVTGGFNIGLQSTVYSAPLNADGSVGAWTTEANSLPAARDDHAMSVWNGRLYVTGGEGGGSQSTVYSAPLNADGSVGVWITEANPLPAVRQRHAMSVWNGRLYVAGGLGSSLQSTVYSAPLNADASVGAWITEANSLPAASEDHAMSAWNGRLYVTGGNSAGVQSAVYSAPLNAEGTLGAWGTETNSLPAVRSSHAMSAWNGRIYLTGGTDGISNKTTVYSAVINADGTVGAWTTESNSLPASRHEHAMTVWNGRLYVSGGIGGVAEATVYSAPIDSNGNVGVWVTEMNPLPAARYAHAMSAWNGRLYVSGGDNAGEQATVFSAPINADGSVGTWATETNSLPAPRQQHAMTAWNGRLYVSGGDNAGPKSTVYSASLDVNGSVGAWATEANALPAARSTHAMLVWNGRLYVAGGNSGAGPQSTVYSASINADGTVGAWMTEAQSLPAGRDSPTLSVWSGRLYVTGGDGGSGSQSTVFSAGARYYSKSGTYFSPLVDLGVARTVTAVSWTQSAAPAGSSVQLHAATALTGNSPLGTWSPFANGAPANVIARYVQYRVTMTPGGAVGVPPREQTPEVSAVSIAFDDTPPAYSGAAVAMAPPGPFTSLPMTAYLSSTSVSARITVQDAASGLLVSTGLPAGLVGQWHFDEGSGGTALDASTHGYTGALANGPLWTSGKLGSALSFDGTDDYVSAPLNIDAYNSLTMEAWVYPTAAGGAAAREVFGNDNGGNDRALSAGMGGNTNWQVFVGNINADTGVGVSLNTWSHVAVVYSAADTEFYLNGVRVWNRGSASTGYSGDANLQIGRAQAGGGSSYFSGKIDEVRIYGVARSSMQILADYASDTLAAHQRSKAYHVLYSTNAGATWAFVSTSNVSLSGTNGSTAAQILQADNVPVITSTGPGFATNRIQFVASDMAGNVSTASFVVLVDTIAPVAISTPTYPGNAGFVSTTTFTFNWVGPSTVTVAGLGGGASYYLQVSDNDAAFAPGNIVLSVSTPAVVASTSLPTAAGAYVSTYTLAAGTYYWRVQTLNARLQTAGPWSAANRFAIDLASPTAASFASVSSTGGVMGEGQFNNLASGVTAQITVQDLVVGLAVSTGSLPFAGDGHNNPGTTSGFGVMYSTDAGQNWIDVSTVNATALGAQILDLAVFNGKLYAGDGANGRVYSSGDGVTWSAGTLVGTKIYSLRVFNGKLYAGDFGNGRVYSSADGATWDGGVTVGSIIWPLVVYNGKLYAGDFLGRVYSSADGAAWSAGTAVGNEIRALAVFNGKLYAGDVFGRVYSSADGVAWSAGATVGSQIHALAVFNGKLYAGDATNGNIYSSADGVVWSAGIAIGSGINSLTVFNGKLYAGDLNRALVSADGVTWRVAAKGGAYTYGLAGFNGTLYAGDDSGNVFRLAPVAAALTGADGSTGAQTLSATSLNLVESTNTTTCGGVAPCGATNQVIFTVSDLAGNVRTAGPFAVRVQVDPFTPVAVSTPSLPGDGAYLGVAAAAFNWTGPSTSIVAGLGPGASYYLQVSNGDPAFGAGNIVVSITTRAVVNPAAATADGAYVSTYTLLSATTYYWRVQAIHGTSGNRGPWSKTSSFVIDAGPPAYSGPQVSTSPTGTFTALPMTSYLSANAVTARITVQDAASGLLVSTGPPAGLVAHWHFDESSGTTVLDASTNSLGGYFAGTTKPAWSTGTRAGDVFFPNQSYVVVPHREDLNLQDLTIEMWVHPTFPSLNLTGMDAEFGLLVKRNTNVPSPYNVIMPSGGKIALQGNYGGTWQNIESAGPVMQLNKWQHLAFTRTINGGNVAGKVYHNGVEVGGGGGAWGAAAANTHDVWISRDPYFVTTTNEGTYQGHIDEVRIFNVARSSAQIRADYEADTLAAHNRAKAFSVLYSTDAGGTWAFVSTNNVTLSGANGTAAAQTLLASDIPVVTSTGPGAGTNRIRFVVSDMAGNVSTAAYVVLVDTASPAPPGCATVANVRKNGGLNAFTAIQTAVNSLPASLAGDSCVVVRDTQTYSEQVTVQGFANNGFRLKIMADPSFVSSGPVISPPALSTAAFAIRNASVTLQGVTVLGANAMPYGVLASSAYVAISSVNVDSGGRIYTAGVALSSWSALSYSSITVQSASGLYIEGAGSSVTGSTMTNNAGGAYALYLYGASSNTITWSYIHNAGGRAAYLVAADNNTISLSTITAAGASADGLFINGGISSCHSNTVTQSYLFGSAGGAAVRIDGNINGNFNTVSRSTLTTGSSGGAALYLYFGASSNTITQSYLSSPAGDAARLDTNANYNTISLSTMSSNASGKAALSLSAASSNTVSHCYLENLSGRAAEFSGGGFNAILGSTLTTSGGALGWQTMYLGSPDSTLEDVLFVNGGTGSSFLLISGAHRSVVRRVTGVGQAGQSGYPVSVQFTSSATLSGLRLDTPGAYGIKLSVGSVGILVTGSTVSAQSFALWLEGASSNTVRDSLFNATVDRAGYVTQASSHNWIARSTFTSSGWGMELWRAYAITVLDSYVRGSAGLVITGSSGTVIGGSTLGSNAAAGNGVTLQGSSRDLTLSSSVLSAAPVSAGLYLEPYNSGIIRVSTNTFLPGSTWGIFIATQTAGAQVWIASNTILPSGAGDHYGIWLDGLASGATIYDNGIYWRSAASLAGTAYGILARSSRGLRIERNRINVPGLLSGAGANIRGIQLLDSDDTAIRSNDIHIAAAGAVASASLVRAESDSDGVDIRGNVLLSSVSAGTQRFVMHSNDSLVTSDYNAYFSSAPGAATFNEKGGVLFQMLTGGGTWRRVTGQDLNSLAGDPRWASVAPGAEDFHPLSEGGRFNPATQAFDLVDNVTAVTIDGGDPAGGAGLESGANGGLANLGSYGGTPEASRSYPGGVAGCARVWNVAKSPAPFKMDSASLKDVLGDFLPVNLSTGACVVVRDAQTYAEQVTVQGFANNGFRLAIMSDPSFVSSAPVVSPPALSTAAFQVRNASVTLQGFTVLGAAAVPYGVLASSAYVTISSVNVDGGGAIYAAGMAISSHGAVSCSSITVQAAHGFLIDGASNTITRSTAATSTAAPYYALSLKGANYNTISNSTFSGTGNSAVEFRGSSFNTLKQCYATSPARAMDVVADANSNLITESTLSCSGASQTSVYFALVSSNSITRSYITSAGGVGLHLNGNNSYTTISQSTITANSGFQALRISNSSFNVVSQSYISNPSGYGAQLDGADSHHNTISLSTISSSASGYSALYLTQSASNTVSSSYIQGSTAAHVSGSTGTILDSNVLAGTNTAGSGVWLTGGSVGLAMSSNVVAGGPQGAGIYVGPGNLGLMNISTNTVRSGAQYGIYVATQQAGARVWITSNTVIPTVTTARDTFGIYLNGLAGGATVQNNGVYFRDSGSMGGFRAYGISVVSSAKLLIDHNRISNPGMVTGGSVTLAELRDADNVEFKFNDLHNAGTALASGFLLRVQDASSDVFVRNNVFLSSMAVSGSSATLSVSGGLTNFQSNYNDFFSSNSFNTGDWVGGHGQFPAGWTAVSGGKDADSIAVHPRWADLTPGGEDFHPRSQAGRYSGGSFVLDAVTAGTIDRADPAESAGAEPPPLGSSAARANLGSYGQTAEASATPQAPDNLALAAVFASSVTLSWSGAAGPDAYQAEASPLSDFSASAASASATALDTALSPQGLAPNTTYYLRAAARWTEFFSYSNVILATSTLANPPAPGAPNTVTSVTPTSMGIIWSENGNPVNVTTYNIVRTTMSFYPSFATDSSAFVATAPLSALVGSLNPNTTYYFFGRARNWNGVYSQYEPLGSSATLAVAPVTAATTFTAVGASLLTVAWEANGNPAGTRYEARVSRVENDPLGSGSVSVSTEPWAAPGATFSAGLTGNTTYYLYVRAISRGGTPAPAAGYVALGSTATLPNPPLPGTPPVTNVTTGSLTANWGHNGNPAGTRYTVTLSSGFWCSGPLPGDINVSTEAWGAPSLGVGGLSANATFYVSATALTRSGGPGGCVALGGVVNTLAAPPGTAVTTFTAVHASSAAVAWSANGNPAGTRYEARLSTSAADPLAGSSVLVSTEPEGSPGALLEGLLDNTSYFLFARAVARDGSPTAYVTLGSTITAALTPTSILFPVVSTETIVASATASGSFRNLGVGLSAIAISSDSVLSDWRTIVASTFTPLSPNTAYTFTAKTRNQVGTESSAITVTTFTLAAVPGTATPTFLDVAESSVAFQWTSNGNPGGTAYLAQASTAAGFGGALFSSGWVVAVSTRLEGLAANTTYFFRVKARNGNNVETAYLSLGSTVMLLLPPVAAAEPFPAVDTTTATATWAGPNGPDTLYDAILSTGSTLVLTHEGNVPVSTRPSGAISAPFGSLKPNTRYYLFVRAVGRTGAATAFVAAGSTYTRIELPAALVFPSVSSDTIVASATAPGGFSRLGVGLSAVALSSHAAFPGWQAVEASTFTPLSPNTLYRFRAKARNQEGTETAESLEFSTYTHAAPPLPTGFDAWVASVTLGWGLNGNPGSTSFEAQASTVSSFASGDSFTSGWAAAVSTSIGGLIPDTTYYLRLRARNAVEVPTAWVAAGSTRTILAPPAAAARTFEAVHETSMTVSWTGNGNPPDTTAYKVALSTDPAYPNRHLGTVELSTRPAGATATATLSGLLRNTSYYLFVAATGVSGSTGPYTGFGYAWTRAAAPDIVASPLGPVEITSVTVTWGAGLNPPGTLYEASASTDPAFAGTISSSGWTSATSATLLGLLGDATFYFHVRALDGAGRPSAPLVIGSTMTDAGPPEARPILQVSPFAVSAAWDSENRGGETQGWEVSGTLPEGLQGHAAAVLGGRLYVTGGSAGGAALNSVRYAPIQAAGALGSWKTTTPLPAPRESHAMAVWAGRLYVAGGTDGGVRSSVWSAPVLSDGSIGEWTAHASLPAARMKLALAAHEGWLYAFGGDNGVFPQSTVWAAPIRTDGSLGSWSTLPALSPPRSGHAAAVSGGRVYLSGGVSGGIEDTVAHSSLAGATLGGWVAGGRLPAPRTRHVMLATPGRLYVAGGHDGSDATAAVWVATVAADGSIGGWASLPSVPANRYLHAGALAGGRLFLVGGSDGGAVADTVWSSSMTGTLYEAEANADPAFVAAPAAAGATAGRAFEFAGLAPNTRYYLRVRSRSQLGYAGAYVSLGSTATLAAPPAAALSTFTLVELSSAGVQWNAGPNPAGTEFSAQASTAADFSGELAQSAWAPVVSAVFQGLAVNTSYYFRASARNLDGVSGSPLLLGAVFTLSSAPVGSAITEVQPTGFTLAWSTGNLPSWTRYEAQASTTSDFGAVAASSVTVSSMTTFVGLPSGATFYARVRSLNGNGVPSLFGLTVSTRTAGDATPPAVSTGAEAHPAGAPNAVLVSWTAAGDDGSSGDLPAGSSFRLQWSTRPVQAVWWSTAAAQILLATGPVQAGSRVSTVVTGLPAESTVSFKLWTADEAGNYSAESAVVTGFSSPFSFTRVDGASGDTGLAPSLAVDRFGNLHLAYRGAGGELRYVKRTGGAWDAPEAPDPSAFAAELSLAVDNDGDVQIAYRDLGIPRLKLAKRGSGWTSTIVEAGDLRLGSLALDLEGRAQVSYHAVAGADLKFASWTGTGWAVSTVAAADEVGRVSAIALTAAQEPVIVFSDDTNRTVRVASPTAAGWSLSLVDGTPILVASAPGAAFDGFGDLVAAYPDGLASQVRVASGTLGTSIVRVSYNLGVAGAAGGLALDGAARAFLAAYDLSTRDLRYLRSSPMGISSGTIDSLGDVGSMSSLVVDGAGSVHVAYYDATSGDLKVAEWTAAAAPAVGGDARSRAMAPSGLAGTALSETQIQWSWTDNAAGELGFRLYGSGSPEGPFALLKGTDTLGPSVATYLEAGLTASTTYYRYVVAVTSGGVSPSRLASAYPFNTVDITSPTMTVNQTGDAVWRRANSGSYDVDFSDIGGSKLAKFQAKASTTPADGGPGLVPFTDVVTAIGAASYAADWSLPQPVFDGLMEGVTNYISLRALDGNGNATTYLDAFYVLKDTSPPVLSGTQGGDAILRASSGTLYDVNALDPTSRLAAFQYSVSTRPTLADGATIGWTTITSVSGLAVYSTDWPVDFAALASDVTSYVSVRAWDVAGTTSTLIDAFYIRKDVLGPSVRITAPGAGMLSSPATVSGTAYDWAGVGGVEWAVQRVADGNYWNGGGFDTPAGTFFPATGTVSWQYSPGIPWADGSSYRLIARSSDSLGNYSPTYSTVTFTFDSAAPTTGVVSPAANATLAALGTITGTSADGGAGVASVEARLRRLSDGRWWNWVGNNWSTVAVSSVATGSTAWSLAPSAALLSALTTQTSYFIAVRGLDAALPSNQGDFFAGGSTFTFVDASPPDAIADLSASSDTANGRVVLSWTATGDDGSSGTILFGEYRVAYATFTGFNFSTTTAQVIVATASVAPGSRRGYAVTNLVAGATYYLKVFAADDAANWSAASNLASMQAGPPLANQIAGRVVKVSSEGITAVLVDCYDASNSLISSTFTVADGQGSFVLGNVPTGSYRIQASWTADGITSSVWQDNIVQGASGLEFVLNLNYTLASLTGQLQSLASPLGRRGAAASAFMTRAQDTQYEASRVELFVGGRRAVEVPVTPTGRWTITNLLPGKYGVRAFNGISYTDVVDVEVGEGELKEVGFVFSPLPEAAVFAFPNPAASRATIRFETPLLPLEAQVLIFDLAGQLVREISGSEMSSPAPGLYHAPWDLRNGRGEPVASGVYVFLVKVRGGSENQSAKVTKKIAVVR